jgi:hypothetical protein
MITFLPHEDYATSLAMLDRQRLNRQRLEAWQIFDAITNPDSIYKGTVRGPAVRMWIGSAASLAEYYNLCLQEWERRCYVNIKMKPIDIAGRLVVHPPWLGDARVHASHRSQLLAKLPEWYGGFGWTDEPGMPYHWPM